MECSNEASSLSDLPKELRLFIYQLTLGPHPTIKVGNASINDSSLAEWPAQPGISRACRFFRTETLGLYYSLVALHLNIQRPSGEYMVLAWLLRLAASAPEALNKIRHVHLIAGLGYSEPPKEYQVDMQQSAFISASRPCAAAYLYTRRSNMRAWSHLVSGALKRRLLRLPHKHCPDFNVVQNLRDVIATVGELSGYGFDGDYATLMEYPSAAAVPPLPPPPPPPPHSSASKSNHDSRLFQLPKELRLAVYEHALTSDTQITIGWRALRDQLLTDGPASPGLLRTCSLLRNEALPVYFARTHFVLNVQRILCHESVLEWIRRCSLMYSDAFRSINHVSVITGSGIRQPPRQYDFRVQDSRLVAVKTRKITQPYTLPESQWYLPDLDALQACIQQMPKKGGPAFEGIQNLRDIIETLVRCAV